MTDNIPNSITGYEDYLDSRDMQERLNYLDGFDDEDLTKDELDERIELCRIRQELIGDYGSEAWGWGYGFIRDTFFLNYAREFAEEIGAIDKNSYWLTCHIDWKGVARGMQQDYWEVTLFGNLYWTREP